MSSEIQAFMFQNVEVRAFTGDDGDPWFVAKDVCDVLGFKNTADATKNLDENEKSSIEPNMLSQQVGLENTLNPRTIGKNVRTVIPEAGKGGRNLTLVNESGLYSLIFNSRKPEAKAFKKWVTSEVLPSIRKHGGYIQGQEEEEDPDALMARALEVAKSKLEEKKKLAEKQRQKLEENLSLDAYRSFYLHRYMNPSERQKVVSQLTKICKMYSIAPPREIRYVDTRVGKKESEVKLYPKWVLDEAWITVFGEEHHV